MILDYTVYDTSTKAMVADKLLIRLLNSSEISTTSGYFDTYDILCDEIEEAGGVWFATIQTDESSDVYYYFRDKKTVYCVRCLTGYRHEDTLCSIRVDTTQLVDAFKIQKQK